MPDALLIGSAAGAAVGLVHGGAVYAGRLKANSAKNALQRHWNAGYYALWTLALWTLFGSYVLYLWLIALALFVPALAFRAFTGRTAEG